MPLKNRRHPRDMHSQPLKKALISFISYDQDSFDVKKTDEAFMNSFYPLEPEKRPRSRNEIWRPSVALAQLKGLGEPYEDLVFDRYYLLHNSRAEKPRDGNAVSKHQTVLSDVIEDIKGIKPKSMELIPVDLQVSNAFDFTEVHKALLTLFADSSRFPRDDIQYYINYTCGTTQIRNSLFLLTYLRILNAVLIAPTPWHNHIRRDYRCVKGSYTVDDLHASEQSTKNTAQYESKSDFEKLTARMNVNVGTPNDTLKALQNILRIVNRIKSIDISKPQRWKHPILITGETGVGKTILAENIATVMGLGKFVSYNCALLKGSDEKLQIIELFGSVTKSYNAQIHTGLFEQAKDGLLFLDEIGELSLTVQAMLLKAIEENKFRKFGAQTESTSNFQLICGTNRDLYEAVRRETFRKDLLERINLWHFKLPPIRKRTDDFELNCEEFTKSFSRDYGYEITFPEDAKTAFLTYAKAPSTRWDGNWREFNAFLTRIFLLATDNCVRKDLVEAEIKKAQKHAEEIQKLGQQNPPQCSTDEHGLPPSTEGIVEAPPKKNPVLAPVGGEFYDGLNRIEKAELDCIVSAHADLAKSGKCTLERLSAELFGTNGKKRDKATMMRRLKNFNLKLTRNGDLVSP